MTSHDPIFTSLKLTLSQPLTRIYINFSTVYYDTLVAKGLNTGSGNIIKYYMKKFLKTCVLPGFISFKPKKF